MLSGGNCYENSREVGQGGCYAGEGDYDFKQYGREFFIILLFMNVNYFNV